MFASHIYSTTTFVSVLINAYIVGGGGGEGRGGGSRVGSVYSWTE